MERKKELSVKLDAKFDLSYAKFNKILEQSGGDFILGEKVTHADFWLASFMNIWDDPIVSFKFYLYSRWFGVM